MEKRAILFWGVQLGFIGLGSYCIWLFWQTRPSRQLQVSLVSTTHPEQPEMLEREPGVDFSEDLGEEDSRNEMAVKKQLG